MLILSSIIPIFKINMTETGQMTTDFNVNIHLKSDFVLKPKLNLILKMKVNLEFKIFNIGFTFDFHFKNNINLNQKNDKKLLIFISKLHFRFHIVLMLIYFSITIFS